MNPLKYFQHKKWLRWKCTGRERAWELESGGKESGGEKTTGENVLSGGATPTARAGRGAPTFPPPSPSRPSARAPARGGRARCRSRGAATGSRRSPSTPTTATSRRSCAATRCGRAHARVKRGAGGGGAEQGVLPRWRRARGSGRWRDCVSLYVGRQSVPPAPTLPLLRWPMPGHAPTPAPVPVPLFGSIGLSASAGRAGRARGRGAAFTLHTFVRWSRGGTLTLSLANRTGQPPHRSRLQQPGAVRHAGRHQAQPQRDRLRAVRAK